ncbi:hypothetical protein B0H17DRAFT_1130659 [Mycena rosella]|uniref:F-box domain-containing protein n=1 Tax=Mycena rosella TaxID=1033263 RepID=A0AAD7DQY8_MYCRO|nr:hypothetical protein B0H17DRAFT_1130659 [Mycena rosella]
MLSLPDLPTELLIEIVKYYPKLLVGIEASLQGVPSHQFSGNTTLRALSQTCRTLRSIFLPVLWERVHAGFYPSLTVTMEECHMENWQPMAQFLRVLQLLPNLRSLTILNAQMMAPVLVNAFRDEVFPSVLSVCFPNVRTLTGQDSYIYMGLLEVAKDCRENIHTVNNLCLSYPYVVEQLREITPRVKQLSIWQITTVVCGRNEMRRRSIHHLSGNTAYARGHGQSLGPADPDYYIPWFAYSESFLEDMVGAALRVLRTSRAKGRKELHIQHVERPMNNTATHIIKEEQIFIVDQ